MNDDVKKKMKELKEALEVVQKIEDQVSWACDFTSFSCISQALEPIYEAIDNARTDLQHEQDMLEYQIEEYNWNKLQWEEENEIKV